MSSSLFDDGHVSLGDARERVLPSPAPAVATGAGQVVKCGGCRGAILASAALNLAVVPHGQNNNVYGISCKQPACVRAVAQDLAAEWAI